MQTKKEILNKQKKEEFKKLLQAYDILILVDGYNALSLPSMSIVSKSLEDNISDLNSKFKKVIEEFYYEMEGGEKLSGDNLWEKIKEIKES